MIIVNGPELIKASMVNREPLAEPGSWFVYQSPRGKYSVIDSGDRITQIEIKSENYKNRFTVRKAAFLFKYQNEYQSKNPGRSFHVSVHMKVTAQDPVLILQNEVNDVEEMLNGDIEYWLSHLCNQYKIEEFQQLKLASHNVETSTEFKNEVKSKGFSISNFEIDISLSSEDLIFYKTQEQIKQNEEIERLKLVEMKRTQELKIQAEEEELERQRRRLELERQNQLQMEREEEERRKKLKEEKRADKERLAQRYKKEGSDSLIFERDEEHAENVDILLSREDKEKEHQRQLELARYEAEVKEKEKREEHNRRMEEKRMEMLQKLMETQLQSGNADENIMRTIINAFDNSSTSSAVLVEKKADDSLLSWKEESPDPLDNTSEEEDVSSKNLWGHHEH